LDSYTGKRGTDPTPRRSGSQPDIGRDDRERQIEERIKEILLEDGHPEECAICGAKDALHVDHDTTGSVRGLLCGRCTKVLELSKGSRELLRQAADYLGRAPTRYIYGETIHLYPNKPREPVRDQKPVRAQKVLEAGTYEAILDNVELKNTMNGKRLKWSFRIPSGDYDVEVVGWSAIRSEQKGTPRTFSPHNRDKSYQWVAAIMDKTPPRDRWSRKDVIGGKCRVVLGTHEDAKGKKSNRVIKVLKHR
jgi:hypothetical protein